MITRCLLLLILRLVLIAYASMCKASIPPIRKIISLAFAATSSPRSKADLPPLPLLTKDRRHLKETHAFSDEANWLIPGIVLVGRYPGSDPYLPCTPKEQTDRIHDLVHRGKVTTFLCLQSELPSQEDAESWDREIAIHSWAHGFRWYADDLNKAVTASVEEKDDGRKPSFIHFPVADMDVIEPLSRLHFLILTLEKVILTRNENVYIHCWGGCGRSGVVGACLLGAFYPGLKAEQATNHVNSYFHLRSAEALMPHRRSPETDRQLAQVKAYFKTYLGSVVKGIEELGELVMSECCRCYSISQAIGGQMKLLTAKESIEGVDLATQIILGNGCCYVWVGLPEEPPAMGSLVVSTMTRFESLPISSTLLRDSAEDDIAQSMGHRMSKKTGMMTFVSSSSPAGPQYLPVLAALEKRILGFINDEGAIAAAEAVEGSSSIPSSISN